MAGSKSTVTEQTVAALRYDPSGPSRQVLWDSKLPGFGCRVTPSGGKQFVFAYRFGGRALIKSLGPVQDFPGGVREARSRAEEWRYTVRQRGEDPAATEAAERAQAAAGSRTVGELWALFVDEHARSWADHTKRAVASIGRVHVLPALGRMRAADVTKPTLVLLKDRVTAEGGEVIANRVIQRFRTFVRWIAERYPDEFTVELREGMRAIKLHREEHRRHHLRGDQLKRLAEAIGDEPNPWVRGFLLLLMLTGSRQGELRRLRWDDVDLAGRVAIIRGTKNGKDHYLQLPPVAVEILRELPVEAGGWVFPGRSAQGHMAAPYVAFKAALQRAGLPPETTLHDIRRSYATSLARRGASAMVVAKALNNTSDVAAQVYVQMAMEDVRQLAEQYALEVLPRQTA